MKILVVEDTPKKSKLIVDWILECYPDCDWKVIEAAHDAFDYIEKVLPDLVIMDILIPFTKDGITSEEASVWLVKEINRKIVKSIRPLVLGATRFADAKRKVEGVFGRNLWNVVVVDEADNDWKRWIKYAMDYIGDAPREVDLFDGKLGADAAILTALRVPEFLAVVDAFGGGERLVIKDTHENWVRCSVVDLNGKVRTVVIACAEDMGMSAMSCLATRICLALRPRYLFLAGIMGGTLIMSDWLI